MPLTIGLHEVVARLLFTIVAGALIGWDRGEHGHPAGLRTTLLVCLAASVAMIEANLLLDTHGKAQDSFAVLDLARYPLGILSGIGFIGAGAILRRGDRVQGITIAATLWFVTVIGLCFGGGQFGLGIAATLLAFFVLWLLKKVEDRLPVDRHATVDLTVEEDSLAPETLTQRLGDEGYRVVRQASSRETKPARRHIRYEVEWRAPSGCPAPTEALERLASIPGVVELAWRIGAPSTEGAASGPISGM
jgi:putative Mg2+ transporter-C (MgtC) family protein